MSNDKDFRGVSFWLKLSLGTILLVFCSGLVALTIIQRLIAENFQELTESQFALQMKQSEELRQQVQASLTMELGAATVNPRLTAAFNLGNRTGDYGRFYNDLLEELEPTLFRLSGDSRHAEPFIRFIDFEGAFLSPSAAEEDVLGLRSGHPEEALERALLPLTTTESEQENAIPRSGFLVFENADGTKTLENALVFPVYDNLGYFMGDLTLVYSETALVDSDAYYSGIWIDGGFYGESKPSASLEILLSSVLDDSIQEIVRYDFEIEDRPFLAFAKRLENDGRFPAALQVSLFSLDSQQLLVSGIRTSIARIGLITLLAAVLLALAFSRRMTRALERMVQATKKIAKGDFELDLPVTSNDEVGRLTEAFNSMALDLALKEKYRSVLNKVTDESVAKSLMAGELVLGGENREVTVLFADIRGFTNLTEDMLPEEVVRLLNVHMSALTTIAQEHGGVVDKFIGDEIMLVFGAPQIDSDAAANALSCARSMIICRKELNEGNPVPVQIGIGIASGTVLAGCIGSDNRLNYTVVGPIVNLASRLCSLAPAGEVRFDAATFRQAESWRGRSSCEEVSIRGFSQLQQVYSIDCNEDVQPA